MPRNSCGHSPLNLSSESLSLSLLSSGSRHETDKKVFYRSEDNFTNMYLCHELDTERTLCGWLKHKYLLTYLASGYREYREPLPLRDVVSTFDMESFFSLFFPRLVQ